MKEWKRFYELNKEYFWLKGQNTIVADCILRAQSSSSYEPSWAVDFGSGPGNLLSEIRDSTRSIAFDILVDGLQSARERGIANVLCGDLHSIPLQDESIQMFVATDILEHLEDINGCMKEMYRVLRPGGKGFITVPAFMCLWGYHDSLYNHKKRYRINEFRRLLESAGFCVEKISYYKFFSFVPLYIMRKVKNILKIKSDDFWKPPQALNTILTRLCSAEKYFLRRGGFPFGSGILCVVGKR